MIVAMRDDVIIEPIKEEMHKSSLVLPDRVIKETQGFKGKIVAIGNKSRLGLSIGDIIVYRPHEGKKAGDYLVIAERHILAKE